MVSVAPTSTERSGTLKDLFFSDTKMKKGSFEVLFDFHGTVQGKSPGYIGRESTQGVKGRRVFLTRNDYEPLGSCVYVMCICMYVPVYVPT